MNVHQTLVDNGSSMGILYLGACEQIGLRLHQFTFTPIPLYGFTGGSLTPIGSIKLAMMVGNCPRISIVMANFLVMDCPSTYNAVLRRPSLNELRAVTFIHHILMKFPMLNGVGQVRGCHSNSRECYNKYLLGPQRRTRSTSRLW